MRAAGPRRRGDLTQGPIARTLLVFALPQIAGNVMQTLNGSINAIWVGRLLGERALAATANANLVMFLLFALSFGLGMAATVRIGQAFGAQDIAAARRTLGTALGVTGGLALLLAATGWLAAPGLLDLLGTPGEARGEALTYLRIIFLGTPGIMLTAMIAMGLRGIGDATSPLIFMVLTAALDIALNPLLILGIGPLPALGIAGSAWASVIATSVGLVGIVFWLYWRDLPLRLRGAELGLLRPRADETRFLLTKGLPMGAQMLVIAGAGLVMIALVNREGLMTAAAYGALLQLFNYVQMPALAIGAAVTAMMSQHIGAGLEARVHMISRSGAIINTAITAMLVAALFAFGRLALGLFLGPDSPAVDIALHIQSIMLWSYLPFGITIVLFGTLRAYGVVWVQLITLFVSMYILRLGAYYALYPVMNSDALWVSQLVSSIASLVIILWVYRRGRWRRVPAQRGGGAGRV